MQTVILLSIAVLASSASLNDDLCVKGESFWCQSLAVAEACEAVDHCKETIWKNTNLEEDESDVCLFCKAVVSDAREMSSAGKSENEVISFLSSASDLLPDSAKASQIKKTIQTKSLQNVLNSDIAPQLVCSLLDVCKGLPNEDDLQEVESFPEETPEQPTEDDDNLLQPTSCNDCTKFFTSLKNIITGTTPAFLADVILDQVCPRTGRYKDMCEKLVKEYLPSTINIIAGYLDPNKVCRLIRMCPKSQMKLYMEEALDIDLSSIDWEELASFPTENLVREQPRQKDELGQPSSCNDCKNFFTSLKNILKNETPAFITDIILDQVCSHLGKYRQTCENTVRLYLPMALGFTANFLDPDKVCQLMRMCPKSQSQIELNSIIWTKLIIPNGTKGDSKTCETCKMGVQVIQTFLKSETVKSSIEELIVRLVCVRLGPFKPVCANLVKAKLRMIMDFMARQMDPSKVCRMIRLCPKSTEVLDEEDSLPVLQESETLDSDECTMCETIINVTSSAIANNKTEKEILKAMREVCIHLPSKEMVHKCYKFVSKQGPKVIDAVRKQIPPHDICVQFGLCTALNFKLLDDVVGSEPCIICRSIVQYLEAYADQNDTVSMIQTTLKTLCHSLSPVVKQQVCDPFVEKYVPWLVHELSVSMPPKFFCTKIRICTI